MDVTADHVIDVPVVRDRNVFAADAVNMIARVRVARVVRVARNEIGGRELMLVDMVVVRMMEMSVVRVIDVVLVHDREMPAIIPVTVRVGVMDVLFGCSIVHDGPPSARATLRCPRCIPLGRTASPCATAPAKPLRPQTPAKSPTGIERRICLRD
jgi:hypothetical protein